MYPIISRFSIFFLFVFTTFFEPCQAQDVKILNLAVNDIVYVPKLDRLIVTTPSGLSTGNSICFVDPYFGNVEKCVFVGSDPNTVAVSDDSKYLYIALWGSPQIVRFDLEKDTIDLNIPLGQNTFSEPLIAEDIKVMPGQPQVIAVTLRTLSGTRNEGAVIYNGNKKRTKVISSNIGVNVVYFDADSTRLYGFYDRSPTTGIRVFSVDSSGLLLTNTYNNASSNYYTESIEYAQGNLFFNSGKVMDAKSGALLGSFNVTNSSGSSSIIAVEAAPDSNVVYFVSPRSNGGALLRSFNKTTFNLRNEYALLNADASVEKLINWGGAGRLAFFTNNANSFGGKRQVVIIRTCKPLIVTPLPTPTVASACSGQSATLSAPQGYNNYIWSNGASGQTIAVTNGGQYTYSVTDSLGCQSFPSFAATVNFDYPPSPPIIESPSVVRICEGGEATLTLSYADPYSTYTYLWSNGATGASLKVTTPGLYSVKTVTRGGCASISSNPVNVVGVPQAAPPAPRIEVIGDTALCSGSISVLAAPTGFAGYRWNTRDTTRTILVYQAGVYFVSVLNAAGCQSIASAEVDINVNPRPAKPNILANRNLLASTAATGNQWYLNDAPIPGATDRFYQATTSGFYAVQVTLNNCTSLMSDLYSLVVTDVNDAILQDAIKVFPNPVTNILNVAFKNIPTTDNRLELRDLTGRTVLQQTGILNVNHQVNMSHLPAGIYVLQIREESSGQLLFVQKITKL